MTDQHPGGWPRKHSRLRAAWWALTGRWTLGHAYDAGRNDGCMAEYNRIIRNGGDLTPVLDAAIYATCSEVLNGSEPQADVLQSLRRKAWQRFEADRKALERLVKSKRPGP
jgi:hypothetical protein